MKRLAVGALLILWTAGSVAGQSPLAFEVASVKAAPPPVDNHLSVRMSQDAGRITYSNVSMEDIVARAYKLRERQVTGPDWIRTQRFDIVAKLPAGAAKEQVPQMLQTLLVERFGLKTHKESKVMPIYALVVGKGGPKMKTSEGETGMTTRGNVKGTKMTGKVTMAGLAESLSGSLDRAVVDMTELSGPFDIELAWSRDDAAGTGEAKTGEAKTGDPASDAASVFTAIQEQLGLKLDARKAPIEFLVVDYVEKIPTEN